MKKSYIINLIATSAALSALSGCNIYQKFDIDNQNSSLASEYAQAAAETPDEANFGNTPWEKVFTDPMLADLIRQALAVNTDLDNARLNVEIAHANVRGARLSYLPSLALAPQGGFSGGSDFKLSNPTYTIPLSSSWEVDIFAKTLNSKRAAEASYEMSQDYCQAVRSQIIGGVANCYYSIGALKSIIRLSEETAEIWKKNVQLMRDFKEVGRTNEAGVVQAEANYYSILASLTDLRTQLHHANNAMCLLMRTSGVNYEIPELNFAPPTIEPAGIEMKQLAARPDVRASERALAAAYYATNSARAAFYPGLSISANYGFTNSFGSFIKNPGEWFSSLAGSLTAPLFMRGQNIARLQATKAKQQQALNDFEKTLLSAAADVSNALTQYNNLTEKQFHLSRQTDDLLKAVDYTLELFSQGDATYLEVLTSQSSLLQAQTALINCDLARAQAIVNLYQNLGGGR